ncbi:hypothetical protein [Streptomyces sp. NPDC058155]|uniref:hypothetical protein n=1 Tax=Streptomyces sp. NPDC058155 TaxID=3346359 RepID=UPI0036E5C6E5
MSDSPGGQPGPDRPDFFDRLLARHTAPRPAAARVRPRLPGPFERVEAVRDRATAPDEDALLWPAATSAAVPPADVPRLAAGGARTHTERERTTVVRTEQEPVGPAPVPRESAPLRGEVPLLRPAAPVTPALRPLPDAGRRAAGRGRAETGPSQTAASTPLPPGADAATQAVSAALRPGATDTAAARDAVRQAAVRRPPRTTEQVVRVQIGRLEVTAGAAPSGGGQQRTTAKERAGATLSLADYLERGRE